MATLKQVGKREFIQHTSQYLKLISGQDDMLVITHRNKPVIRLSAIKTRSLADLRGLIRDVKVKGDINDPILPGYDQW